LSFVQDPIPKRVCSCSILDIIWPLAVFIEDSEVVDGEEIEVQVVLVDELEILLLGLVNTTFAKAE
jgi:hypothetical protein